MPPQEQAPARPSTQHHGVADDPAASIAAQKHLDWREGNTPISLRFDDPYYSLLDGLAESRHVFLAGNDLPQRLRPGFHIAELGFGTGLNMLATLHAWHNLGLPGQVYFTSFEAFPLSAEDIARALKAFPEVIHLAEPFLAQWAEGMRNISLPGLQLEVIEGDARTTLPLWQGHADAWFLDGFSPAKNPELWGQDLMHEIGRHSAAGTTCATYSAAGHIRRALEAAGFAMTRSPGHANKRHMSRGTLRPIEATSPTPQGHGTEKEPASETPHAQGLRI